MELTVLFAGPATATLRWLLKCVKTPSWTSQLTVDDLHGSTNTRVVLPMRTTSGEFIGTMTMDFLLKMPSFDAFRLLGYDVLAYVSHDVDASEIRTLRGIVNDRVNACSLRVVSVEEPQPDSELPVSFRIGDDPSRCSDIKKMVFDIVMPTITRKGKELREAAEKAGYTTTQTTPPTTQTDTTEIPEIKVDKVQDVLQ